MQRDGQQISTNNAIIDLCKKRIHKFDFIIVSVLSPLLITRIRAKKIFGNNYLEFFVKTNISDLFKRDPKSLYKKAKKGNFEVLGYNSKIKYEKSRHRKIIVNTSKLNKKRSLSLIKKSLLLSK